MCDKPGYVLPFARYRGLADDPFVRAEVAAAHDTAVDAALGWFARHGTVTRRGRDGVHQVDTQGVAVAVFRQHTSRSAGPQLHTHAIVVAKVQDPTGKWLSLDAGFLKHQQRSIGWIYASALRAELAARLGVAWGAVTNGHADIDGVPSELLKVFSARAVQVKQRLGDLVAAGSRPTTAPSPTPEPCTAWSGGRRWRAGRPRCPSVGPCSCGFHRRPARVLPWADELPGRARPARGGSSATVATSPISTWATRSCSCRAESAPSGAR